MAYISYSDASKALDIAAQLVNKGRWEFREDPYGRRHIYERQFVAGKDPSLTGQEVVGVFNNAAECVHEKGSDNFFRVECELDTPDWTGRGRVLFHVDSIRGGQEPRSTVVVTAFRVTGWKAKFRR